MTDLHLSDSEGPALAGATGGARIRLEAHQLLLGLLLLLLGGSVVAQEAFSLDALRNATYVGIYDEEITLADGNYLGTPYSPDSSARPRVRLLEELVVRGDLDADGDEDALVLLEESGGGTGRFLHLAAMIEIEGAPVNLATIWIGDRIPVLGLAIEDGLIVLDIVDEGEGDAACCKGQKFRQVLQLQDDVLTTLSREDRGRLSVTDIEGVTWKLGELDVDQAPLAEPPVTINFEDGRAFGSAGCNDFQTSYAGVDAFSVTVGEAFSTRKMCAPLVMAQEDEFLAKLQGVYGFGFWLGHLVLQYDVGGSFGWMQFERLP